MAHISVTDEEVCLLHPLQILPSARTASLISSNSRASHAGQGMGTSAGKDCGLVSFHMQIILDTANNVRDFSQALRPRLRRGGLLARFAQLQAVDVEGVPPALRADLSDENVTRPDEVVQYEDRHAAA